MKRALLRIAFLIVLALLVIVPVQRVAADAPGSLSKHDQELLATAIAQGRSTVNVLIASKSGANNNVASSLASLGATIRYRDDGVSYLRAIVPTGNVVTLAKSGDIDALNLDEIIPLDDPKPEASDVIAVAPPGPGTPPLNPYMPTQDIGAPQFVAAHPIWDGRGVKVGEVDTGIDLLTPELQSAKALDGSPVRKIVDWVTFTDPLTDGDPTWVNMATQVVVSGGAFTSGGVTYTGVAADGQYRFGVFQEAALGATSEYGIGCGADVNRNGVCNEKFAVLWNTATNQVWVDSNADKSFAGEKAMTDYKVNFDIGTFGKDNPATPVRESVPFVVQTDGPDKFVNIGIVSGAHGTHVAGIIAGKKFFGGQFNGTAPEAQLVSVRACLFVSGCTSHALIEGMIYVEKQSNVDVTNMSIGGLPALNDGNTVRDHLYNRLITQTKAQMFISAGNSGPGINTVGDPSVATLVMSVGAYVSSASWTSNYGATVPKADGLFVFSSRGPREDGGFKPNIVAPGSAVSTIPAWQDPTGQCLAYNCPPGYAMFNGTSMAAPEATGGAALLISAAKQSSVQYKPDQLRQAINSSARYLPGYGAYEQGNGLFQVGAAWDLLKKNIKSVDILSQAPVNTIISGFLATPNKGLGIYQREGWQAGDSKSLTITFTRTSGGSKPVNYNLTWVGNDGTFSSAASIALPLNQPVNLAVTVHPAAAGAHSALLNLDDPDTVGLDYQVMNTVVAAERFPTPSFSITHASSANRADKATFFFYVPPATPAYNVDLQVLTGRARLWRFHPYGVPYPSSVAGVTSYCTAPCTVSQTTANPMAGVWEASVEVSRASTANPATFNLTAAVMGVDVTPATWVVDPSKVGTTYTQVFSFKNRFAPFTGGATGTALGSAFATRPTIAAGGANQTFNINVPANSTSLTVKIGGASDASADLDLYVYKCTTGTCVLAGSSTGPTAEEVVTVANPAAGLWKALVNPYAVPAGTTQYNYLDVIANPMYGTVSVTDPAALHPSGSTWSATASTTPLAAPGTGRFLQGFVQVKTGTTVLGSAEVDLKNVAP